MPRRSPGAAQSTGKKGHYQWEGMDYTSSAAKSNKKDIADLWVEQLGDTRRNRVSTVEMVDAGFGLGMQAVSRASLQEAREAEDRERRVAAARESARLRAADKASRHETVCCAVQGRRGRAGATSPLPRFSPRMSQPSVSDAATARGPCLSAAPGS